MAVPDRPDPGESIASEWGDAVHDYTFAPSGASVYGDANTSLTTTFSKMSLNHVNEDPGGYLDNANNQVEIPTGGEGLYIIDVTISTINGSAGAGFGTRAQLRLNGNGVAHGKEDNNGGTAVRFNLGCIRVLAATDILSVYCQKIGSGTAPDATVVDFTLVRIGAEFGA